VTFKAPTLLELSEAAVALGALSFAGTLKNKTPVEHVVALHEPAPKGLALSWWNGKKEIPKAWSRGVLIAHPDHNAMASTSVGWVIFARRPRLVLGKLIAKFFIDYVPPFWLELRGEGVGAMWPNRIVGGERLWFNPSVTNYDIRPSRSDLSADVRHGAGQALEWDDVEKKWFEIPHLYGVRIGDDVTIGPGATIQRGLLNDTVIDNNVKIGPGVNIGHGSYIGESSVIAANACLGGSVVLGQHVTVGMNATIRNGVQIGPHATVGMGAVVLHDVNPGVTVAGNPAKVLVT
jgi:acetyltransferase-like isoleucine patch superfamily enzyme